VTDCILEVVTQRVVQDKLAICSVISDTGGDEGTKPDQLQDVDDDKP